MPQECAAARSQIIWIMNDHTKDPAAVKSGAKYKCYLFFKRMFDILSSGLALLLFSWLFLILALAVKLSDGGSVFYRHKRVGKNGKDIFIPKFRSMKRNADKLEDMLTPEQLEQYRREYKIDNDPRVTKVGHFLRRTSLDELPQLWSIFKGDLSVVGPRPLMREEAEAKYGEGCFPSNRGSSAGGRRTAGATALTRAASGRSSNSTTSITAPSGWISRSCSRPSAAFSAETALNNGRTPFL